jgi:hypothetical protein
VVATLSVVEGEGDVVNVGVGAVVDMVGEGAISDAIDDVDDGNGCDVDEVGGVDTHSPRAAPPLPGVERTKSSAVPLLVHSFSYLIIIL